MSSILCKQYTYVFVYEKINQNKVYVWIDSIFEAQNICYGSEIVGLLDHSYNKCALSMRGPGRAGRRGVQIYKELRTGLTKACTDPYSNPMRALTWLYSTTEEHVRHQHLTGGFIFTWLPALLPSSLSCSGKGSLSLESELQSKASSRNSLKYSSCKNFGAL